MYWAELGEHVMIERAYLDGNGRQILIGFGVAQPNGLTIDIEAQRLYWCDTALGTIAYGDITSVGVPAINTLTINDGTLNQPFSLTLSETSVFWTDWGTNSVYSTHKDHGNDEDDGHFFTVYTSLPGATPRGLEVVSSNQQPTGIYGRNEDVYNSLYSVLPCRWYFKPVQWKWLQSHLYALKKRRWIHLCLS